MSRQLLLTWALSLIVINASSQTGLYFDGINEFVLGTNNPSLDITDGCIEAWIKTPHAGAEYRGIVVKHETFSLYLLDDVLVAWDGQILSPVSSEINLADDQWHHVALSFRNGMVDGSKFYVDGLPVKTITYHSPITSTSIAVGQGTDRTNYSAIQHFKGLIDQVRVWNTYRTETEILNYYNRPMNGDEEGLVMLWQFEEGSGILVNDVSGNDNSGTLYNMDDSNWMAGYSFPESSDLMAQYLFDGNANDISGNGHHGTVYGATLTDDRNGNTNSAYYFDGINDYIDLGDWENGGATSITFWAKWDAFTNYSRIVDLANGPSSNNIIVSNYQTAGKFFFQIYGSTTGGVNSSGYIITRNQWDFYCATVDETGVMKIYKNGVLQNENASGTVPAKIVRTKQYVGRSNFSQDGYFNGTIDDLRIYSKKLDQDAITSLLNQYETIVVRHVKPQATGTGDGSSWKNASGDLQSMIDASSSGEIVKVAEGTYLPNKTFGSATERYKSFILKSGVIIQGSYSIDGNKRSIFDHPSILSGEIQNDGDINNNVYHVVHCGSSIPSEEMVLDGFIIQDGHANNGSSYGLNSFCNGAGIMMTDKVYIKNCIIKNNTVTRAGSGVYCYDGGKLINCIIYNNNSIGGAAVHQSSKGSLMNCTIVNNHGNTVGGVSRYIPSGSSISNCIIWGNTSLDGLFVQVDNMTNVSYSAIQNYTSGDNNNIALDSDNLAINGPHFKNITEGFEDWNLLSISPCVDIGNKQLFPQDLKWDLNMQDRVINDLIDAGALECKDVATRVNTPENKFNIKAYPNPVNELLTIEIPEMGEVQIRLYNLKGRLIHSSTSIQSGKAVINTTGLSQGTYIIQIVHKSGIEHLKIIKQ